MSRSSNGPWLRASNQTYYATINGKQTKLSKDKNAAYAMWHQLMSGNDENEIVGTSLVELANSYLAHQRATKEPITLKSCERWVTSLVDFIEEHVKPGILAKDVLPKHVLMWLHGRTSNGRDIAEENETRRNKKQKAFKCQGAFQRGFANVSTNSHLAAMRAISAFFNYGLKTREYRGENPVSLIPDKPQYTPRETYITNDEWDRVIEAIPPDSPFRDFVLFLRLTGCRPGEARNLELKHFDGVNTIKWSNRERGKYKNRQILLNDEALKIFQKWALKHPEGPVFRNRDDNPWTRNSITTRFYRLSQKTGIQVSAYTIRHTFCTNALKAGESTYDVAKLMGHADTKMVERVYGHLQLQDDRFMEASKRIAQAQSTSGPDRPDDDDTLKIHSA